MTTPFAENKRLLLVRHAQVTVDPQRPAREWVLSAAGRANARQLANDLRPYRPTRVITSAETKAVETGQIVAASLKIPWETAAGLHEHDRQGVPYLASQAAFKAQVARLFQFPDQLVFGNETAAAAADRLTTAVRTQVARYPDETLIIATHGTVIALFLGRFNPNLDTFELWQRLSLPWAIAVSLPDMQIQASSFSP